MLNLIQKIAQKISELKNPILYFLQEYDIDTSICQKLSSAEVKVRDPSQVRRSWLPKFWHGKDNRIETLKQSNKT